MFYDRIENANQLKELTTLPVFGEIIASEKAEDNYVVVDSDPRQPSRNHCVPFAPIWNTCQHPTTWQSGAGEKLKTERGENLLLGELERHPSQGR